MCVSTNDRKTERPTVTPFTIRVPDPLLDELRTAAAEEYDTPSNLVRNLIREYIRDRARNGSRDAA